MTLDPMRDEIAKVLHAHSCECHGDFHSLDAVVAMSLIARVRADERGQIQAVLDGFPDDYYDERFGYAVGLVRDHLAARGGDA